MNKFIKKICLVMIGFFIFMPIYCEDNWIEFINDNIDINGHFLKHGRFLDVINKVSDEIITSVIKTAVSDGIYETVRNLLTVVRYNNSANPIFSVPNFNHTKDKIVLRIISIQISDIVNLAITKHKQAEDENDKVSIKKYEKIIKLLLEFHCTVLVDNKAINNVFCWALKYKNYDVLAELFRKTIHYRNKHQFLVKSPEEATKEVLQKNLKDVVTAENKDFFLKSLKRMKSELDLIALDEKQVEEYLNKFNSDKEKQVKLKEALDRLNYLVDEKLEKDFMDMNAEGIELYLNRFNIDMNKKKKKATKALNSFILFFLRNKQIREIRVNDHINKSNGYIWPNLNSDVKKMMEIFYSSGANFCDSFKFAIGDGVEEFVEFMLEKVKVNENLLNIAYDSWVVYRFENRRNILELVINKFPSNDKKNKIIKEMKISDSEASFLGSFKKKCEKSFAEDKIAICALVLSLVVITSCVAIAVSEYKAKILEVIGFSPKKNISFEEEEKNLEEERSNTSTCSA